MVFKKYKQKKLSENIQKFIRKMEDNQAEEMKKPIKRNMYPMCTEAQFVVYCLCDLFLGKDWYVTDPLPNG